MSWGGDQNSVGPWVELEKKVITREKQIAEIDSQLKELKRQKPPTDEQLRKLHFEKIQSLTTLRKDYARELAQAKEDLRYRFPERGLVQSRLGTKKSPPTSSTGQEQDLGERTPQGVKNPEARGSLQDQVPSVFETIVIER